MPLDKVELRSIVETVVAEVLDRMEARASLNGRLAYTEAEAAALIGVPTHVLRDARIKRHEITGTKVGKTTVYTRGELERFLEQRKNPAP